MRRSLPGSLLVRTGLRLLRGYTGPAAHRFAAAAADPAAAQDAVLARLVRAAATTGYGREHGVAAGDDLDAFRARLPVIGWDELQPWLAAEREQPGALVPGKVAAWVRSGGNTGPAKRVPYNAALKHAFAHMFYVWAHDLLANRLHLTKGYCYLNIPPPETVRDGRGDIEDEAEYLSGPLGALTRRFFVVDPRVRRLNDADAFLTVVALSLLSAADLEVISVWFPEELLRICRRILAEPEALAAMLDERRVEREGIEFRFDPLSAERRAALLAGDLPAVWPELKIVSAWNTGDSAPGAAEIERVLPGVPFQGKGMIAVEAPLTIPLEAAGGYVPLIDEILFELEADDGSIRALAEADTGAIYRLIVSQPAGLLRYRIGDRVRVSHRWQQTPCLEYVDRG